MHYRTLGSSGLKVSSHCLGTMTFGDRTDLPEARNIVASALAGGVNFIDTADAYKTGASETMVGEAIHESRSRWVLATKDAHELYRRVGFRELHRPQRWMERPDENMQESPDYWNPIDSQQI